MKVGIAFDLIPTGPSRPLADGPDDRFEEFDKPETVQALAQVLRDRGHEVVLLGDGLELIQNVLSDRPDIVWNMSEGEGIGRCREARVPAFLEMLDIPFTGSDPLTLAATLDKSIAKRLIQGNGDLEIPEGYEFRPQASHTQFLLRLKTLIERGPVLLKPSFEGSSKGILARCLVKTFEDAWQTAFQLATDYQQPILAEEFISGDEVTVGLVGNEDDLEVLGIMRVVPKQADPEFIYSIEVKRDWKNRVGYEAPARFDTETTQRILDAARQAYHLLGCRDLARIDFRVRDGIPYFIEANPLPGLAPITSDLVILAEGYGISYPALIGRIFEAALKRLGMAER